MHQLRSLPLGIIRNKYPLSLETNSLEEVMSNFAISYLNVLWNSSVGLSGT